MITAFKQYLTTLKLSPVSRKLYLSDVRRFLSYLGSDPTLDLVTSTTSYSSYLDQLSSQAIAPSMLKRTIASLRQFGNFISLTYSLPNPVTTSLQPKTSTLTPNFDYIKHFTKYLESVHLSPLTIKSYKSDITRYLDWASTTLPSTQLSELLIDKNIKKYLNHLTDSNTTLPSTIERKEKSIARFGSWYSVTYQNHLISDNNSNQKNSRSLTFLPFTTSQTRKDQNVGAVTGSEVLSAPEEIANSVKNHDSRKRRFPLLPYFTSPSVRNFATLIILMVFASTLAIFGYRQFSRDASLTAAYPSTPVTPNRQLSFQGRLENAAGTPIVGPTNMVFKLWNALTAGTQLYSTGTCSITSDTDGVFSTQIGGTCGAGITSSVFTENSNVWLEVTVGSEVLAPRQPIASVAYALNSETLQGLPVGTTASTIPYINSANTISMTDSSPRLTGTSGTFQISAPSLSFVTTTGSNGNITFAPDGTGQVNVNGNTTTTNFFNVSNAQLTTGSLIAGTVANNNAGFKLIDLYSGSTPTSKFSVNAAGDTTMAGDLTITGDDLFMGTNTSGYILVADGTNYNPVAVSGDISITSSGATTIGADKITEGMLKSVNGPTDEMCLSYESTVGDFEWQTCGTGGSGGSSNWRINLGTISPLNDTLDLLVGSNATSSAKFAVNATTGNTAIAGNLTVGGGTSTISNSSGDLNIDSFGGNIIFATDDDLIPTLGAGSADLGSTSLPWDNVYTNNLSYAGGAGTITIADNLTSAFRLVEGGNAYLDITTTDDAESFTLNLPVGGATSHTANLFNANIAQTINIGTGTAADTINIGTGGTTADDINLGGLSTSHVDITGVTNFAGGTTYYVDASGNAKFLDLQVADTGNPGLTIGNGTIGFAKIGASTIFDNTGNLTLDSDTTQTDISDDLSILGGNLLTNQTTATIFNTTATTLSLGGAATTALNIGNGSGNYTDISLGSGAGTHVINIAGTGATAADTIRIGTGGTAADTITIGNSVASTTLGLTGGNYWSISTSGQATFSNNLTANGSQSTLGDNSTDLLDIYSGVLSYKNASTLDLYNGHTSALNIEGGLMNFDTTNSRVGIGTVTPTSKLEISSDDATNNDISNILTLTHTTSGTATGGSDDSYTKALLHADAADGSASFTDDTGKTWTALGNAQTDTAQSKFGGSAALFDGTGDAIDTPDNTDFDVGSGDFTIDFWFRTTTTATTKHLMGQGDSGALAASIATRISSSAGGPIDGFIYSGSTQYQLQGALPIAVNTWYHIALVRDGNTLRLFINGAADSTLNVTGVTVNNSPYKFAVGRLGEYNSNNAVGWIDEFRFSKGIARWTSAFTPPSSAYSYNTNTGIGTGLLFRTEDASGTIENSARISGTLIDATSGSEDSSLVFETRAAGAALARTMRLWNTGDLTVSGWLSQDSNPDIAENIIVTDPSIGPADIVALDPSYTASDSSDIYNHGAVKKAGTPYSQEILGVISTDPGIILNAPESGIETKQRSRDNERPLTLAGRVPVKVNTQNGPLQVGDYLTVSNTPGIAMKATQAGQTIGRAMEPFNCDTDICTGTILVMVGSSWYEPPSDLVTSIKQFGTIIANALQAQTLQVASISPLAAGERITINGPVVISPDATSSATTPLLTVEGTLEAASISARVAVLTDIQADTITARNIVADTISANHIEGLDAKIASMSGDLSDTQVETITGRIKARLAELSGNVATAQDLPLPPETSEVESYEVASTIATSSATIDFATINNYLAVIGSATITTLDITNGLYTETINSKTGQLALAEGTLLLDSTGQVMINGDLTVSGKIVATELNLERLNVYNEAGVAVATIDASGSANLASLTTNMITIASPAVASESALATLLGTATSNATAGQNILVAPGTELTINSPYITPDSLVYLTPTGNTDNKVLFVKSKDEHSFTVAIDAPASSDISFNWWIIQLAKETQDTPL